MAFQLLLELAASAVIFMFYVLSACLACFFFYILSSIIFFSFFYIKEMITQQSSGKPPIAGTVFHQLIHFNTLFDFYTEIFHKHRTFRLIEPSRSEILTADPANIEHILKSNFSKYSKGQYNYCIMKDLFGDGIFAVDGEKWRHQRKLASIEFATKVFREFSGVVFRENAGELAKRISDAAGNAAGCFDMQELLMKSTLDSMFKIGFGVELDSLSGSDELGARFSRAFDEANFTVGWRYVDVLWKIKKRLDVGSEAELRKNMKVIDEFVLRLIERKREQMTRTKQDLLSRFMLASEEESEKINDAYLRDIALNFLIAGKDSTAITLSWFFYALCKQPQVQEKVAAEVSQVAKGKANDAAEFAMGLSDEAIDEMHYLHAALAETLRLYPAVPLDGKSAEEDDVLPDGFKVKKGDGVTYSAYAMGRMSYLWGEDAGDFRPERWLRNGIFQPESPFKFTAFNAGPRICLGREIAYKQMKVLAATLVRFFRFKLQDQGKPARYRTMFTLHIDGGLPLFAMHRQL